MTNSAEMSVSVRLDDLCRFADWTCEMIHKMADGCYVRLYGDVSRIHNIMEEWASDEATLGNCSHNHRCRLCDEGPWLLRAGLSSSERDAEANDTKIVRVVHEDLCRVANSVATMVHDLDNGKHKYVKIEISIMRRVIQKWVEDEAVLGGGCHNHECQKCVDFDRNKRVSPWNFGVTPVDRTVSQNSIMSWM